MTLDDATSMPPSTAYGTDANASGPRPRYSLRSTSSSMPHSSTKGTSTKGRAGLARATERLVSRHSVATAASAKKLSTWRTVLREG